MLLRTFALLLIATAVANAAVNGPSGPTFSNAIPGSWFRANSENELLVYNSTSGRAALTHFWITGTPVSDDVVVRYFIDGETSPSIEFTPAMAAGTGFDDDEAPWGSEIMGKGARTGGWFNNMVVPFSKSLRITFVSPKDSVLWLIARGFENHPVTVRNLPLPASARLRLLKEERSVQPLEYVAVAKLDKGVKGIILQTTLAVRSNNLNFLEGCYRMYTDSTQGYPGMLLSSGTEDFFSSAYYFNAGKYRSPESGLTHMNGSEATFSAYRNLDRDPVAFQDGMTLVWRNGDTQDPKTGLKCTLEHGGKTVGSPGESQIQAYTWVYAWDVAANDDAHVETIGTALSQGYMTSEEKVLFEYNDCNDRSCAMTHLWTTSSGEADDIRIRYYIDGETSPSIDMRSSMMAGVAIGGDSNAPWGTRDFGHEANTGAWLNNFLIPFSKSIRITYTLGDSSVPSGCFYGIVRGLVNVPYKVGAVPLPANARLRLQVVEGKSLAPFELVNIAETTSGRGMLYLTTMHVDSGDLNFLEGCIHAYSTHNTPWPGILLSTGTEDFFDSAYYFDGGRFHASVSGLTELDTRTDSARGGGNGGVSWGAYRFQQHDPVMFNDGFVLQWRNGDLTDGQGIKCFIPPTGNERYGLTSSNLTSYVWYYHWDEQSEMLDMQAAAEEKIATATSDSIRTFGTGLSNAPVTTDETDFYSYNVTDGSTGAITHLWITGTNGQDDTTLRFYFDGETVPSVAFTPVAAAGRSSPGPWNAGAKMGRGANTGGWWFNFPMPFARSVRVTYQAARAGRIYIIIRGAENLPVVVGPESSLVLPASARLRTIAVEATPNALDYVTLSSLPSGTSGFIYLSTLNVDSANLNFLEGCFRLYPTANTSYPGVLLSSGAEDFYDSAFYFDGGAFRFDISGLSFIDVSAGAKLSMYRFQDADPLFFSDGFKFVWRNGDTTPHSNGGNYGATVYDTKCIFETGGVPIGSPSASHVSALTFVYTY